MMLEKIIIIIALSGLWLQTLVEFGDEHGREPVEYANIFLMILLPILIIASFFIKENMKISEFTNY